MPSLRKLLCQACLSSISFAALPALAAEPPTAPPPVPATAPTPPPPPVAIAMPAPPPSVGPAAPAPAPAAMHGSIMLQTGTGKVLTLPRPAENVFVANPKIAEVRPASSNTLFVFGIGAGQTTVAATDGRGNVIAQYELTVEPAKFGAEAAQAMIHRLLPNTHIFVEAQDKGLLLTGSVASPDQAAKAVAIAKDYGGAGVTVDNEITIGAPTQVTLNVRIAEMSRTVIRNLGINWQALGTLGSWKFAFSTPVSITSSASSGSLGASVITPGGPNGFNANALIDALADDNLAEVLAEPNLTVMSGQPASFQVGGEFPIPVGYQNGQITITFKNYGIILNFLPTVMNDGRINLHVAPEVSQLDKADGIQLSVGNSSIQVPGLTVRRAESTVELGSGQSFALAGLLQQTNTNNTQGLPGLGDVPVLGAFFRSNNFERAEDELVIIVTPYIVRPVNTLAALHLPTDGFSPPTDIQRLLFMRQVAQNHPPVPVRIPGDAGFMVQ
jgi:pilus assembly protein CpaC